MNINDRAINVSTSPAVATSTTTSAAAAVVAANAAATATVTVTSTIQINISSNDHSGGGGGSGGCPEIIKQRYPSILIDIDLAIPQWQAILITVLLTFIILLTIIGNILVILSVFTYKPLRIVQNFFIVSLAVADLTVAILVLPFNVLYMILGRWDFGIHLCKMWLTSDVLCCTSSILNLCAIALDRYWAITDPINYAQKRTLERVLYLIAGVWILSLVISSPPLIGWNDWPDEFDANTPCTLNSNPGYRIYSALGSFFIPLVIMTIVYIEIFIATRRRLRERARASKINAINLKNTSCLYTDKEQRIIGDGSAVCGGGGGGGGVSVGGGGDGGVICTVTGVSSSVIGGGGGVVGSGNNHGDPNHGHGLDQDSISSETNHNEPPPKISNKKVTVTSKKSLEKMRKKELRKQEKERNKKNSQFIQNPIIYAEDSVTDVPPENSSETKPNGDGSIVTGVGGTGEIDGINGGGGGGGASTGGVDCIDHQMITIEFDKQQQQQQQQKLSLQQKQQKHQKRKKQNSMNNKKQNNVYQFIEEKQKISLSKERRAARTLGIIMGVFILCWVPFFLLYIIAPFCPTCCPSDLLIDFLTWLGYINSALNPIIYTIFNLDYRRAFKKLLGIKF